MYIICHIIFCYRFVFTYFLVLWNQSLLNFFSFFLLLFAIILSCFLFLVVDNCDCNFLKLKESIILYKKNQFITHKVSAVIIIDIHQARIWYKEITYSTHFKIHTKKTCTSMVTIMFFLNFKCLKIFSHLFK